MHSHRCKLVCREHTATLAGTRIRAEKRQNMSVVLDCPQKANPGTRPVSVQTGVATNLRGQKEAAQEIIRANVSFCFTSHPLFACNLKIQRSHMAVVRVYKGMLRGTVLFQENASHNIKSQGTLCRCGTYLNELVQQPNDQHRNV